MSSSLDKDWNWPLDTALDDGVRAWWADERPPVLVGWERACVLSSASILVDLYWIDEEKRRPGEQEEGRKRRREGDAA